MNVVLICIGNYLNDLINTDDSRKTILILTIQELLQLGLAIFLFKKLVKKDICYLGFNLKNIKLSLKIFTIFSIVWIIVIVLYNVSMFVFNRSLYNVFLQNPLPSKEYIQTYIGFQAIFPGLCEETLFRGFILYVLINNGWTNSIKIGKVDITYSAILSGIIFMCAHIYYNILPFEITHINYTQLLIAFFLGTFQAIIFEKTKSLLGPVLIHNFSNLTNTLCGYLLSIIGQNMMMV
jgi:membrane protease YdiL (CAAX protease family)